MISALTSLAMIVVAVALVGAFVFLAEVSRAGPNSATKIVQVERGAGTSAIGQSLEAQGVIRNGLVFRAASEVFARGQSLKAGEYEIAAGASLRDVVAQLAEGRAVQHAVTIPEGYTIAAAISVIEEAEVLSGEMPEAPPEGSILPETYHVQRGTTRAELLQQMRDAHDLAVEEVWAQRAANLPITTPEEMVILASIVERETGVAEERPRVAAVFVNRLRRHMQLQSDPTIIYGVCLRHPRRCRNGRLINERSGAIRTIRESEIAMDTGYNTYRIARLPPTPIANPGRASMEAVVNPAETEELFFVADGTGGHIFAETNEQHQANVRRWREIEAQRLAQEAAERAGE
jgi:UPF0755 protein